MKTELSENWQAELAQGICVIDFFATWCGPCRMMAPIFESTADDFKDKPVNFFKIDVDQYPEVAAAYGIQSIPTLVVLKDGLEFEVRVGVTAPAALRGIINSALEA